MVYFTTLNLLCISYGVLAHASENIGILVAQQDTSFDFDRNWGDSGFSKFLLKQFASDVSETKTFPKNDSISFRADELTITLPEYSIYDDYCKNREKTDFKNITNDAIKRKNDLNLFQESLKILDQYVKGGMEQASQNIFVIFSSFESTTAYELPLDENQIKRERSSTIESFKKKFFRADDIFGKYFSNIKFVFYMKDCQNFFNYCIDRNLNGVSEKAMYAITNEYILVNSMHELNEMLLLTKQNKPLVLNDI
eukprot:Pgem_evm1s7895